MLDVLVCVVGLRLDLILVWVSRYLKLMLVVVVVWVIVVWMLGLCMFGVLVSLLGCFRLIGDVWFKLCF